MTSSCSNRCDVNATSADRSWTLDGDIRKADETHRGRTKRCSRRQHIRHSRTGQPETARRQLGSIDNTTTSSRSLPVLWKSVSALGWKDELSRLEQPVSRMPEGQSLAGYVPIKKPRWSRSRNDANDYAVYTHVDTGSRTWTPTAATCPSHRRRGGTAAARRFGWRRKLCVFGCKSGIK